jgi:fumarate hydratase subunit beta
MVDIISPVASEIIAKLTVGMRVLITGVIYTARDVAHRRLVETLDSGLPLPFDISGQTLYYMGPSPAPLGKVIGSCGPTTSGRMDIYTPRLVAAGLKVMMGKGNRSEAVREVLRKYRAVYLATIGGAGAYLAQSVKQAEIIAYNDLGPGAIYRLTIAAFPAIVANDIHGGDLFQQGQDQFRR